MLHPGRAGAYDVDVWEVLSGQADRLAVGGMELG
jgi:hypothetical protein